ncbi:MAG: hypothetical protein J0L69_14335 [Bacteroidetes bacterium]|nr:hypothetical protein [Bacteroidota bacterium]
MCFSATASFAAGTLLGAVGVASMKEAKEHSQRLFASIPLWFSIQQFVEGFVWLALSTAEPPGWKDGMIAGFLLFALVIWPVWVSVAMLPLEKEKTRKYLLYFCLLCGIVFASFAGYYMTEYPMTAQISNYHILYKLDFPFRDNFFVPILYIIATVLPLLISSVKRVPVLGGIIFLSYVLAKLFFYNYVISVWCFFAAIISVVIYMMVSNRIKVFENKASVKTNTNEETWG